MSATAVDAATGASASLTVGLTIGGKRIRARSGQSVLDAANDNGILIPSLCHSQDLTPVGSCRL